MTMTMTMMMQDTGMRPSEVFEMRLENLHWAERRIWIPSGKTAQARRFVGMTERSLEFQESNASVDACALFLSQLSEGLSRDTFDPG